MATHPVLLRSIYLIALSLLGTYQGALAHAGHEHGNGLTSSIWLQMAGGILIVVLVASLVRQRPEEDDQGEPSGTKPGSNDG